MSTPPDQRSLLLLIAALLALMMNGCTTAYYANGKVAIRSSANFQSFTSTGESISIVGHKPSDNLRAVGAVVGTTLTGAALFRPIP